jgi:predicted nucleic acid-binding protein
VRAVSNAGPLIHLSWLDLLGLLPALFDEVVIPPAVQQEVLRDDVSLPGMTALKDAFAGDRLRIQAPRSQPPATMPGLDTGEADAIALMHERAADVLLMDERRGRRFASQEGFPLLGTIGVLRLTRARGLIPAVTPLLAELRNRGFRISAEIVDLIQGEEERSL